jgi:hypothetical protein
MTERWKANTRLSTAPWKSRKPRFPHFHSSGGGGFYGTTEGLKQQKLKPFTQKPLHLHLPPGSTATDAGLMPAAIVPVDVKAPVVVLIVYMDTLPADPGVPFSFAT